MICLTMGLLTGSLLAGLMINKDWFFLSVIFGLALAIFTVTHGEKTISPRTKNTFKKR